MILIRVLIFSALFLSGNAHAQSNNFGVGAIVGAPTGVSLAYRLASDRAIDGALGWSLGDDVNFHVHSTYLFLKPGALQLDELTLDVYFGIGGRIKDRDTKDDDDDLRVGARAPLGLHYMFDDPSIEVFGEVALILDVIEKTDVDFNLALGGRFWF